MRILAETMMWFLVIYGMVTANTYIIVIKKESPKHWFNGLLVCIFGYVISNAVFPFTERPVMFLVNFVYVLLIYWAAFNWLLNLFTGKPLLYLGDDSDPEEDSIIDRIERSIKNPGATLGIKIVLAIMCLFILLEL